MTFPSGLIYGLPLAILAWALFIGVPLLLVWLVKS